MFWRFQVWILTVRLAVLTEKLLSFGIVFNLYNWEPSKVKSKGEMHMLWFYFPVLFTFMFMYHWTYWSQTLLCSHCYWHDQEIVSELISIQYVCYFLSSLTFFMDYLWDLGVCQHYSKYNTEDLCILERNWEIWRFELPNEKVLYLVFYHKQNN